MTFIAKPRLHHPTLQTNKVGYTRRDYEGTGLGLYLSKHLANLLGGHLTAESEFGIGSRFSFIVPRDVSQKAELA